jgi:hypothetical protein
VSPAIAVNTIGISGLVVLGFKGSDLRLDECDFHGDGGLLHLDRPASSLGDKRPPSRRCGRDGFKMVTELGLGLVLDPELSLGHQKVFLALLHHGGEVGDHADIPPSIRSRTG